MEVQRNDLIYSLILIEIFSIDCYDFKTFLIFLLFASDRSRVDEQIDNEGRHRSFLKSTLTDAKYFHPNLLLTPTNVLIFPFVLELLLLK